MAIDPASITLSPLYIVTASPIGNSFPSGDTFVAELNQIGFALDFSTYLGGCYCNGAAGTALDSSGKIYVAGLTSSTNLPVANAFQATQPGRVDAFVVK